jgi:hypothetical protein
MCRIVTNATVVFLLSANLAFGQSEKSQPPKRLSVAERLEQPIAFNFEGIKFYGILDRLKSSLDVPMVVDVRAIQEEKISLTKPITGKSGRAPALDELRALFSKHGISVEVRHHVLYLSTERKQGKRLGWRIYRLSKEVEVAKLIKKIKGEVSPTTWNGAGASGQIERLAPTVIVVYHNPAIQREVQRKYEKELSPVSAPLDRIALLAPTKGASPLAPISQALRNPISADYPETPLAEALTDLAKNAKVKLRLDGASLTKARISPAVPVSVNFKHLPAESVLTLMLEGAGLDWTLNGDEILVTTPKIAAEGEVTITYDVKDMVPPSDIETLGRALQRTIRPTSWTASGGAGTIEADGESLKIKQSAQVHRLIENWLADLRTAIK